MAALPALPSVPRRRLCIGAAVGIAAPWLAGANEAAAPAEIAQHLGAARLRGSATLRFFGLRICDLRLWVGSEFVPAQYSAQDFALELLYARALDSTDIARRSIDEMARIGAFTARQGQAWRDAMEQAFPDVVAGDRLTGIHRPQGPSQFFHNGRATRAIDGADFAQRFFGIWLAPQTSEPALRRQLLSLPP